MAPKQQAAASSTGAATPLLSSYTHPNAVVPKANAKAAASGSGSASGSGAAAASSAPQQMVGLASRPKRASRKPKAKTAALVLSASQRAWIKVEQPHTLSEYLWNLRVGDLKLLVNYFKLNPESITSKDEAVQAIFAIMDPEMFGLQVAEGAVDAVSSDSPAEEEEDEDEEEPSETECADAK
jgi:hypothetical protein